MDEANEDVVGEQHQSLIDDLLVEHHHPRGHPHAHHIEDVGAHEEHLDADRILLVVEH